MSQPADWSEPLILIEKHKQEMLHLLNANKHEEVIELTFSIEAECVKIRNFAWKRVKP